MTAERSSDDPALARAREGGLATGTEIPFARPERPPMRPWVPIVLVGLASLFGIVVAVWPREADEVEPNRVYELAPSACRCKPTDPALGPRLCQRSACRPEDAAQLDYTGVPGAPCRGISSRGDAADGSLVCEQRRP